MHAVVLTTHRSNTHYMLAILTRHHMDIIRHVGNALFQSGDKNSFFAKSKSNIFNNFFFEKLIKGDLRNMDLETDLLYDDN